jgi:hypothetical protein
MKRQNNTQIAVKHLMTYQDKTFSPEHFQICTESPLGELVKPGDIFNHQV